MILNRVQILEKSQTSSYLDLNRNCPKMPKPLQLVGGSVRTVQNLALQPIVPASILAFIAYGPQHLVQKFLNHPALRRILGNRDIKSPLRILLALGVARLLNKWMSKRAVNNWSLSPGSGWQWQSEIAVVTGGCAGIGRGIVLGLVEKGVEVVILDVQDLPADMEKSGLIKYYKCDVTSADAVRKAADHIRLSIGHPSILINNAGLAHSHSILDTPDEYLQKIIGVNLLSHWTTTKEFLPNMILKDKGHIVTIASIASYVALPTAVHYSASKAGALAFHEGLKAEVLYLHKAPGVLTSVVHPSWVATDLTAKYGKQITASHGPMMLPEVVAKRVVDQLMSAKGAQIFVPDNTSWLSTVRGWPSWMQNGGMSLVAKRTAASYNPL